MSESPSTRPSVNNHTPLLAVRSLVTRFSAPGARLGRRAKTFAAVDGVSFEISRGESLGLVGETGCGKTTLGRTILRLVPADSGRVIFDGMDLLDLNPTAMRRLRRRMQMIFQDPAGSLNPRMTAAAIVAEPLVIHRIGSAEQRREQVAALFERVGLDGSQMHLYPHELSGGQRQRLGIARAIALNPEFIVCDEPVSALDVSIQSQILNLLTDLKAGLGLSYLFVAHDLAVVRHFCDRVAVMYLGRIVELGSVDAVFRQPRHPYTLALRAAVLAPDPTARRRGAAPSGEVPSPVAPPPGCRFHPRCPLATDICRTQPPTLAQQETTVADQGPAGRHLAACHHADKALSELDSPGKR